MNLRNPQIAIALLGVVLFVGPHSWYPTSLGQPRPSSAKSLVRTVDLNIGQRTEVQLADGSKVAVQLLKVDHQIDQVRMAVRRAEVTVEINGHKVQLVCSTYHLPIKVAGVQIDCPVTSGYLRNSRSNPWGLRKDARLRLWPGKSPWIKPGSFVYPVKQKWFANPTQMANEPTYVNGDERPDRKTIYYHYGLDIGGAESMVDVLAATDALVVSKGTEVMEAQSDHWPVRPRYDVIYLLDRRGWYYRYSHLSSFETDIRPGKRVKMGDKIGSLGKEGASGGWSHLHFEILSRQPSGMWGTHAGYAYLWQAYLSQYKPAVVAVARPHGLIWAGQRITLDGSRSYSSSGKIASYDWLLTDGTTAQGRLLERRYDQPGTYAEFLRVSDIGGRQSYDVAIVQVLDKQNPKRLPPTIHACYFPTFGIRAGDPVTFKVRSFRVKQGNETWNFGDGTETVKVRSDGNATALAKDGYAVTTHRFAKPGHYLVKVHRTDANGVRATAGLHVEVTP